MAVTKDSGFPVSARDFGGTDVTWPTFTTPGTNRMCVAMFLGNGSVATSISTMTSGNLTWTMRVAVLNAGNNWCVEIWTAWAASVVTTEQIDTTFSGSPFYSRSSLLVFSLDGSESAGAGNTASSTTANDGDVSITSTATGSLLLAGFPYRSAGGDIGVDANSTSQYNAGGGGGFNFNERACSRATTDTSAYTLGFTTAELFESAAIAGVEVKAAVAADAYTGVPKPQLNVYRM